MKETTLQYGRVQVTVIDPESEGQRERLEQAVIEFFREVERDKQRKGVQIEKRNFN